jgi:hypothetical protein
MYLQLPRELTRGLNKPLQQARERERMIRKGEKDERKEKQES